MALSRTRFPRGTPGPMLDAIARAPLWAHGLDYGHGTGHGVGYFLNVHEGPQTISHAVARADDGDGAGHDHLHRARPVPAGPVGRADREPGAQRAGAEHGSEFGEFLEFETLTLCPIDTRCIEPSLLRDDEVAWLNGYHATVRERLAPRVTGDALAWLEPRTAPIA